MDESEVIAIHEAAHGVVSLAEGMAVFFIEITPDSGRCCINARNAGVLPYVTALCAGPVAEMLAAPNQPDPWGFARGPGGDWLAIAELLKWLPPDEKVFAFNHAKRRASALVRAHAVPIQRLAARLLREKRLDEAEIRSAMFAGRE